MRIESIPHWFVSSKTIDDLDNDGDIISCCIGYK